jgi:hypothetical protein
MKKILVAGLLALATMGAAHAGCPGCQPYGPVMNNDPDKSQKLKQLEDSCVKGQGGTFCTEAIRGGVATYCCV